MVTSVPKGMFTSAEIKKHRDNLDTFTKTAADYLDWVLADHQAFFKKWGVSKYFGNRKPEHKTKALRIQQLQKFGKPTFLADQQVATACILLGMQAFERGFNVTGQPAVWKKIHGVLKIGNKFYGTDLQIVMQQLGWSIYYWNPDPAQNAKWDEEDKRINPLPPGRRWNPVWGGHVLRHASVMNKNIYYDARVDNKTKLVGFKKSPPASMKNIKVFLGIAHAGYHVFLGRGGTVIEAHSMRTLIDPTNIETAPFNPLAAGGAPRWTRSEKYRSGLLCVPKDF